MSTTADTSMTVTEAAEALAVSERTVWRYLKSGKLAGETVGEPGSQRTLIAHASVEAAAVARGRDPNSEALRAERDRLAGELARAEAERAELRAEVDHLRLAASRGRPSVPEQALTVLFTGIERVRARRAA